MKKFLYLFFILFAVYILLVDCSKVLPYFPDTPIHHATLTLRLIDHNTKTVTADSNINYLKVYEIDLTDGNLLSSTRYSSSLICTVLTGEHINAIYEENGFACHTNVFYVPESARDGEIKWDIVLW